MGPAARIAVDGPGYGERRGGCTVTAGFGPAQSRFRRPERRLRSARPSRQLLERNLRFRATRRARSLVLSSFSPSLSLLVRLQKRSQFGRGRCVVVTTRVAVECGDTGSGPLPNLSAFTAEQWHVLQEGSERMPSNGLAALMLKVAKRACCRLHKPRERSVRRPS